MGILEKLSNPVKLLKDVKEKNQARHEKKLFFEEQFQIMVENGNYEKAVELIYDEAHNLDSRIKKEVSARELAQKCRKMLQKLLREENNSRHVKKAIDEIERKYDLPEKDAEN